VDPSGDPLGLTAEQMRELGYRTIDLLVNELSDVSAPAVRRGSPGALRAAFGGPPPDQPRPWEELLREVHDDVLSAISRVAHPGYFAFIPACSTFPAALGDLIMTAMDIDASMWLMAAGPSQVELTVLDWFKEWIGYPTSAAGVLVSGGSAANLTALACAREALLGPMSERAVIYASDQSHSSVARASRIMGFRPDQVRVLPTDGSHRILLDAVVGAIEADLQAGLQPLAVAANAGATNTGAIDPLPELAELCHGRGLWLHVDAAYGGAAALTERGRAALAGLELADSVTLDPHKWLYQPIECGCALIREGRLLGQAFTINPDYLSDRLSEEVNFSDLGLQLTRSARAFKIWLSFQYFGADAFRAAIDRSLDLAQLAEEQIANSAELELMSPASLGIVCFRRRFPDVTDEEELAALNAELVRQHEQTGMGAVSSTRLHGRYAVRMCVMNHTTGPQDVTRTLEWFAQAAVPARRATRPARDYAERRSEMASGWGQLGQIDAETVQNLPLLADLGDRELEMVVRSGLEVALEPGQTVIDRWQGTRSFYLILAGTVEIRIGEERVRELGPGEFFGELAALDWGAGFGYVRTATVIACDEVRLLALSPGVLHELMRSAPEVDRQIRAAVRERLKRV